MEKKICIYITESYDFVREALILSLKKSVDIEVVGQSENGRELLNQLKTNNVDVILLAEDIAMLDGNSILKIISNRFPSAKVIVMCNQKEITARLVSHYLEVGAAGFISKTVKNELLVNAIKSVVLHGHFLDNATSKLMIDHLLINKGHEDNNIEVRHKERAVLVQVCNGKSNKEIAKVLNMSTSSVDYYKNKLYSKTKCRNKNKLAVFALKNNLITLSELT